MSIRSILSDFLELRRGAAEIDRMLDSGTVPNAQTIQAIQALMGRQDRRGAATLATGTATPIAA